MESTKLTREEVLKRWNTSKEAKKRMVAKMKEILYEDYKTHTGKEPQRFNVL